MARHPLRTQPYLTHESQHIQRTTLNSKIRQFENIRVIFSYYHSFIHKYVSLHLVISYFACRSHMSNLSLHERFNLLSKNWAVPWLRRLAAGLSPRQPGTVPGSVHVGFVVDKTELGQLSLRVLRFSPASIISQWAVIWGMSKVVLVVAI
jgi:hypothetical protein